MLSAGMKVDVEYVGPDGQWTMPGRVRYVTASGQADVKLDEPGLTAFRVPADTGTSERDGRLLRVTVRP